jgi:hypothetical protein
VEVGGRGLDQALTLAEPDVGEPVRDGMGCRRASLAGAEPVGDVTPSGSHRS